MIQRFHNHTQLLKAHNRASHHLEEGTMKLATGILAGVLAVMLGLSGCATSGSSGGEGPATGNFLILNDQLVAQIKDGVSTKEDVKALLGAPWRIGGAKEFPGLTAEHEVWSYSAATQTNAFGLGVVFKNGIVEAHSKNVQPIAR
ncbi:MAG: hypothetical protein A3H49_10710 [Nitrospirae bacterium RIFCSPLOWO2_02_FULL_62_14]|nr:MAG: hypothetical protein A3H49_10710 [Nitrospirae bacterium RIFCSPLOWO2_02_FULL_62_14]